MLVRGDRNEEGQSDSKNFSDPKYLWIATRTVDATMIAEA
jgi:hypothetical protein